MIKAMAYGCAIVALNTPFNNEMLNNGEYGLFFEKKMNLITDMINYCEKENILMKKLRSISNNGITKKYNWDYIANQYIDVFQSI